VSGNGSDVVAATILRAKLEGVVDEMAAALSNTAHSSRISTSRAFACGVLDQDGEVAALDHPLHLASLGRTAAAILDYYRFQVAQDDVFISNDPYGGGTTIHQFTILAPLGDGDDIVAYLAVQAHMSDIGGVVMGNYHPTATELWAEGARFTPLKLVREGRRRRDAVDTIVLNSRDPEGFRGDLDAMLATVNIGRQRLGELIRSVGREPVMAGMADAIRYAERRIAAAVADIPEGRWRGEARLDHDGHDREGLAVRVALERVWDGLRLDFTETDDQSAGFVNSTPTNTVAYALLPLLGLLDETVPHNAGLLRPLDVVLRPGSLVDPAFPAPTGWCREHMGYEVAEAVSQALASALPQRAGLGYANRSLVFTVTKDVRVGGVEEQLAVTDLTVLGQAGSPGRAGVDGWGQPGPASAGLLLSVEEFENGVDATVERLEYITDSAGAGCHRGSPGTETVIRFPADSRERLYACVAGTAHPAPGYAGGSSGSAGSVVVRAAGGEDAARLVQDRPLAGGAELRILTGGGGGFGPAHERPPEQVLSDVVDGYVSPDAAAAAYAVAIDGAGTALDEAATARLREEG
jgi:N-methylhydantoinase B